jgi:hypothetical protein
MARKAAILTARGRSVVAIGSRNRAKTEGVRRAFKQLLRDVEFEELDFTAVVKTQPMSMDETVKGAKKRAELAIEGWVWRPGSSNWSTGSSSTSKSPR